MKINANQLSASLKTLSPLYVVSGDEPLLMQESVEMIYQAARQYHFTAREVFDADAKCEWTTLLSRCYQPSLFDEKRIIEIRLKGAKLDENSIQAFIDSQNTNTIVIMILPKLDAQTQKTKWFTLLESSSTVIQVWPIEKEHFPAWLATRLRTQQLPHSAEIVQCLANKTEGNLLAAKQTIEKLALVNGKEPLSVEQALAMITDANCYTVFDWVEASLQGDLTRALRILDQLRQEKTELTLLVWAMAQELRLLSQALSANNLLDFFREKRIWPKRQPVLRSYLSRNTLVSVYDHIQSASRIDRMVKGFVQADPWLTLTGLTSAIAGKSLTGFSYE